MAKEIEVKEAVKAPIVIPHGLELDADCTPIASSEDGLIVERAGKKFRVFPGDGVFVDWNWVEVA